MFGLSRVKISTIFVVAFVLGLGVVVYTVMQPPGSPSTYAIIAGLDTERISQSEGIRNVLFVVAAGITLVAIVMAFFRAGLQRCFGVLFC